MVTSAYAGLGVWGEAKVRPRMDVEANNCCSTLLSSQSLRRTGGGRSLLVEKLWIFTWTPARVWWLVVVKR